MFRHILATTRKKTFWRIFSYPIDWSKKVLSDILASSSSQKRANTAKVVLFRRTRTSHAGLLKMPRVSSSYGVLEVKCKRKWFWGLFLLLFIQTWTARTASLPLGKIQKLLGGRVTLESELKYDFSNVFGQSPLLPCILHNSRMNWLNSPV